MKKDIHVNPDAGNVEAGLAVFNGAIAEDISYQDERRDLIARLEAKGYYYNWDKFRNDQLYQMATTKPIRTKRKVATPGTNRKIKHCDTCGTQLTDGGYCPICDDGEEHYTEGYMRNKYIISYENLPVTIQSEKRVVGGYPGWEEWDEFEDTKSIDLELSPEDVDEGLLSIDAIWQEPGIEDDNSLDYIDANRDRLFNKYYEELKAYFEAMAVNRAQDSVHENFHMFRDDDDTEGEYIRVASKSVLDSDGFSTDYTWYKTPEGRHIFIFGDSDIYTPETTEPDWEAETEAEAQEWFDDYEGFTDVDETLSREYREITNADDRRAVWSREMQDEAADLVMEYYVDSIVLPKYNGKYIIQDRDSSTRVLVVFDLDHHPKEHKFTVDGVEYITTSDKEAGRIIDDAVKAKRVKSFNVDVESFSKEKQNTTRLNESRGRFVLEVWVPGSGGDDDRERFIMASDNLQKIIDEAYEIDLDYDEAFYLSDMKGIYPYDLDQCYDAEELEDAIYNQWHYDPSSDMRKYLGKMLLPQNENINSRSRSTNALTENSVSSKLPEDIDDFLQELAQSSGMFDYKDIVNFSPARKDITKLRYLMTDYEDADEKDTQKIAERVSKIIKKSVQESRNLKEYYRGEDALDDVLDWLQDHKQAWDDFTAYFSDVDDEDLTYDMVIDWISEHDTLYSDYLAFFNIEESLKEDTNIGKRVRQKYANPYNVGTIIDSKYDDRDGDMVRVKWDYSDGPDVEWVNIQDVSAYSKEDEEAGVYESVRKSLAKASGGAHTALSESYNEDIVPVLYYILDEYREYSPMIDHEDATSISVIFNEGVDMNYREPYDDEFFIGFQDALTRKFAGEFEFDFIAENADTILINIRACTDNPYNVGESLKEDYDYDNSWSEDVFSDDTDSDLITQFGELAHDTMGIPIRCDWSSWNMPKTVKNAFQRETVKLTPENFEELISILSDAYRSWKLSADSKEKCKYYQSNPDFDLADDWYNDSGAAAEDGWPDTPLGDDPEYAQSVMRWWEDNSWNYVDEDDDDDGD